MITYAVPWLLILLPRLPPAGHPPWEDALVGLDCVPVPSGSLHCTYSETLQFILPHDRSDHSHTHGWKALRRSWKWRRAELWTQKFFFVFLKNIFQRSISVYGTNYLWFFLYLNVNCGFSAWSWAALVTTRRALMLRTVWLFFSHPLLDFEKFQCFLPMPSTFMSRDAKVTLSRKFDLQFGFF